MRECKKSHWNAFPIKIIERLGKYIVKAMRVLIEWYILIMKKFSSIISTFCIILARSERKLQLQSSFCRGLNLSRCDLGCFSALLKKKISFIHVFTQFYTNVLIHTVLIYFYLQQSTRIPECGRYSWTCERSIWRPRSGKCISFPH